MPIPDTSTTQALEALTDAKTHRAKCLALGLPVSWRGTVGRIIYGHAVSLAKENEMRARLGLPPIAPPLIPVPPCPDCGSVHHARCNGNNGTAVVLASGEVVTTKRGPWQSKAQPEVAAMVRGLQLCLERKAGRAGQEGG